MKIASKFYVVVILLTVFWLAGLIFGLYILTSFDNSTHTVISSNGLCLIVYMNSTTSVLLEIVAPLLIVFIGLGIIMTFSILSCCYIRNNIIDNDNFIKRAVAKVLFFLWIIATFLTIHNVIIAVAGASPSPVVDEASLVLLMAEQMFGNAVFAITFFLVPIVTLILLKPLRDTLRRKCLCMKTNNSVAPQQAESDYQAS